MVLLELVERLGNLMRTELRKSGTDESLQPVHLQALMYLSKANRYSNTPQALADYLGLTKGTVSQTLLLLDRRGLIERFEDDIDRRVVRLRLSVGRRAVPLRVAAQPRLDQRHAQHQPQPHPQRGLGAARGARPSSRKTTRARPSAPATTAASASGFRSASSRCGLMGDRISGPETRKICWFFEPKTEEAA